MCQSLYSVYDIGISNKYCLDREWIGHEKKSKQS